MQVKENTPIKFSDWITGLPINKRRFIVPQYMQQLFNLPEELKLNIVSPSIREILAPNLILTEEMCQVLNYPGLEGISVDTIAFPFWTKFKHLPKKEEYRVAYQICFTLNLMREDKEPEKSAITLVRRIRKDLYNNLINKFIVPLFTDVNRVNFNAQAKTAFGSRSEQSGSAASKWIEHAVVGFCVFLHRRCRKAYWKHGVVWANASPAARSRSKTRLLSLDCHCHYFRIRA